MKKHFRLLMAALIVGSVAMFSSCGGDDDDDDAVVIAAPTIEFVSGGDAVTLAEGAEHTVKILAEQGGGAGELANLTVIATVDGTAETKLDSTITGTTFTMTTVITKGSAASESWTFTVKNSDGKTASISVTLTLEQATPFAYENIQDGIIWHLWGNGNGAYDLANNTAMMMGDDAANKDMINTTAGSGDPFVFGWESGAGNGTEFVKAAGYDYANATVESAAAAYAAGTASTEVADVAIGDVYVAKLRGGSEYCVIYIEDASDTDPKSGEGYISFTYKKTSETAGQ